MALTDLKSNLANYRSNFVTPSVESQATRTLDTPSGVRTTTNPNDSVLDIDGKLNKFSPNSIYTPTKYFPEKKVPITATRWIGNLAPVVNYFSDVKSGAVGFTTKFNDINKSNFVGITGATLQNKYQYPILGSLSNRLMNPAGTTYSFPITTFPGPQNFFDNTKSGADGFTLNFTNSGNSQFQGISSISTYTYPKLTSLGTRLMNPPGTKFSQVPKAFPGPQDFFNDQISGATGFTANMISKLGVRKPTQFTGANESTLKYTYPAFVSAYTGNDMMQPKKTVNSNFITAFPGPQDFFNDLSSGAKGFTLKFTNTNTSQYLGISGKPLQNKYTYPASVVKNKLMQPSGTTFSALIAPFPGPQDFFSNIASKGFTIGSKNTPYTTQFTGISGLSYTMPSNILSVYGTNSLYSIPGTTGTKVTTTVQKWNAGNPSAQNFFSDVTAKGFTLGLKHKDPSLFTGIDTNNNTYFHPGNSNNNPGFVGVYGTNSVISMPGTPNTSTFGGIIPGFATQNPYPVPQNFFDNDTSGAKGFVIQATDKTQSNFIGVSGFPLQNRYTYPSTVIKNTLMNPPGTTYSIAYGSKTVQFGSNPLSLPNSQGQSFFDDLKSGAKGFTVRQTDTQFLGINGLTYTYPKLTTLGDRLMKPKGTNPFYPVQAFGTAQNFFSNFAANGFTLKQSHNSPSQFLGISGLTYQYPKSLLSTYGTNALYSIPGTPGTIVRPWTNGNPNAQNFFGDKAAKGFTLSQDKIISLEKSQFAGINGLKYNTPFQGSFNTAFYVELKNTEFGSRGYAELENQLGDGSLFRYWSKDGYKTKIFSRKGYSYSEISGQDNLQYGLRVFSKRGYNGSNSQESSLLLKIAQQENSPSALDNQYTKFDLQKESFNATTFLNNYQPYVTRKIGERWNLSNTPSFTDDGLIRGGMVTAVTRSAFDLVRIGKWIASPKGLLWVAKQVGLGLTNPKVESIAGSLTRTTRIHTGVASLLSVPTTAFGLHFTRHGLPFTSEFTKYETVSKINNPNNQLPINNRLVNLTSEYGSLGGLANNLISSGADAVMSLAAKTVGSQILSGIGGPNSLYGVGVTTIKRIVDTKSDAVSRSNNYNVKNVYNLNSQYINGLGGYKKSLESFFPGISILPTDSALSKNITSLDTDKNSLRSKINSTTYTGTPEEKSFINVSPGTNFIVNTGTTVGQENKPIVSPGTDSANRKDLSTAASAGKNISSIHNYATIAYAKIPKSNAVSSTPIDFRNQININTSDTTSYNILGHTKDKLLNYYLNNNLETRYGFGKQGQVNASRTDPNSFTVSYEEFKKVWDKTKDEYTPIKFQESLKNKNFRGDLINVLDIQPDVPVRTADIYKNAHDFIEFFLTDSSTQGNTVKNPLVFRCNINGFSDTFTPGWTKIDIMGRPDGSYLYTTFDRSISFNFTVAATSRTEMIPLWRKLNYLSTYTMPKYTDVGGIMRPTGPFMRITIGNLFQQTPGFIESLSYTVPDDATWDIAEDYEITQGETTTNNISKQLPMMVEVSMTFKIVSDFRPQLMGRAYSLSKYGATAADTTGNWLTDSSITVNS